MHRKARVPAKKAEPPAGSEQGGEHEGDHTGPSRVGAGRPDAWV